MEQATENLNSQEKDITKEEKKKGGSWQGKLIVILVLLLILGAVFGWFYYQETVKKIQQVEANIGVIESLDQERANCLELLKKTAGNFTDYEYCKKLLQVFQ